MYISPTSQLNRRFFYFLTGTFILISIHGIFIKENDAENYLYDMHILMNSIFYLIFGIVAIHTTNLRDKIFGVSKCPHCNQKTWNVARRLKMNPNLPGSCKCSGCKKLVKLKYWPAFLFLSCFGVFLLSAFIGDDINIACIISEIYLFFVMCIMIRFTPLRVALPKKLITRR